MRKFKRIFLIVTDSLGIGEMVDSEKYGDKGANTFVHISEKCGGLNIPTLNSLGIGDLDHIVGCSTVEHNNSYVLKLNESSNGKDTMTGHWEMMGLLTTKPFITFTEKGFPQSLINELEEKTGHKIIGNYAASGTEIIKVLGEDQIRDDSLIVYTSADSVLQIAASEETTGLKELYRCCEIAREICLKPEYYVGRVIARPFIGNKKENFKRTSNRHDYAVSPSGITVLDILKNNNIMTSCIGKIGDIFNMVGVTKTQKTISNQDGMDKIIDEAKNDNFEGLCFLNLVEFDSEFGHRRNPFGYGRAIEEFDVRLNELLKYLKDDDLLMITADHGNDPTHFGSDHTREKVPLICYNNLYKNGRCLEERNSFADIGMTILKNFNLNKTDNQIGTPIKDLLDD